VTFGTWATVFAYSIPDMSPKLFVHLIDPAVRSLALGAMVAFVLLLTRTKSVSLRLSVWKIVVCAALAMPILAASMPPLQIAVPLADRIPSFYSIMARHAVTQPTGTAPVAATQSLLPTRPVSARIAAQKSAALPTLPQSRRISIPWLEIVEAVYLGIAACLAFRFALGWFLSQRLRHFSAAIADRGVNERFKSLADSLGLRQVPDLAASHRLAVPLTCGVVRPAVLLPADWRDWDSQTLDAVLAHELSHVARRDALTERLALVHRIVFWFSPLAWWLPRQLADLAEEASDQAALAAGTEPSKYAEILLGFLNDLSLGSKRVNWQGVAMAQAGRAEKRLDRILQGRIIMTKKMNKALIALVGFSSVPAILLAASLQPRLMGRQIEINHYPSARVQKQTASAQESHAVAASPAVAALPAVAPAPAPQATPAPSAVPVVAAAPAPEPLPEVLVQPVVVTAPAPRALPSPAPIQQAGPVPPPPSVSYSFSTDGADAYAIVNGKSSTMSGSFARGDFQELEALHQKMDSDFIWFERDGRSYIIIDPATVQRAQAAFAAQSMLGQKQGEIGEQLGSLGELQGVLGEQQGMLSQQMQEVQSNLGNIKIQMPDISNEMQAIQENSRELSEALSKKDLDELNANMAQMQAEIAKASKEMAEAQVHSLKGPDTAAMNEAIARAQAQMAQEMAKFSAEQSKLGTRQEELSRTQEELGKEQEKATKKAQAEIRALIDQALANGTAKPAPKP
jgi:beta-lactamase regulating signal transducer with metallopeptidase domain